MPPKQNPKNSSKSSNSKAKSNRNSKRSSPLASTRPLNFKRPVIISDGGRYMVRGMEALCEVHGSVSFDTDVFEINPGLVTTFPWLSSIAKDFESYTFRSLKFSYVPTCAKTVTGIITFGCDYDAADDAPGSMLEFATYEDSKTTAAHEDVVVNCSNHNLLKFVPQRLNRFGALASNLDIKTYDVANFFLARSGFVDSAVSGFLFADYVVEFQTPQLNLKGDYYSGSFTTVVPSKPFNVVSSESGIIAYCIDDDELLINSSGDYLVVLRSVCTVAVDALPTFTVGSAAVTNVAFGQKAAATTKDAVYTVTGVSKGDLLHLDWTGTANTIASCTVRIARI